MRTRMRLVLPLAQVAIAIILKTHNFLGPDPLVHPAWQRADNQFCNGLNAPATLVRELLGRTAARLECLLWIPAGLRSATPCCWGYLSYPVDLALDTIVYFGLVWLVWYGVSVEIRGGGQSVLASKTRMRAVADALAIVFSVAMVAYGLEIRSGFRAPSAYWNVVAVPYYIWGVSVMIFYGRDLRSCFRTPQNAR